MPEAAVNEDARSVSWEHEIGLTRNRPDVKPVPETIRKESFSYQHLGLGIHATNP
jgi:hypothetical protein